MALAVAALLALGLALVPAVVTDSFTLQVLLLAIMFGALGACWNLVGGFLGRISFGHAVFVGVGGYTTLLLLHHLKLTPLLGIPLGGLISAAWPGWWAGRRCACRAITSPWPPSRCSRSACC